MPADDAVLAVDSYPGEVAHMLVGTGQLVEQGRFAAVLVAHQGEGQPGPLRQGIAAARRMKAPFLAKTGVLRGFLVFFFGCRRGGALQSGDTDLFGVRQAEGQLVPVDPQLHGIAHRGELDHGYLGTRDDAHIQKMLAQGTLSADGVNPG